MPEKKTYVALLRGINVGGNRRVAMADLRGWAEEIGLQQVRTYVQSGNLVFKSQQPAAALEKKIERKIAQAAGFEVRVVVRSAKEIREVMRSNPFVKRSGIDLSKLQVTFLAEAAGAGARAKLKALPGGGDESKVGESEIFLYCPNGYGSSKLVNSVLEKAAGGAATTRNWRTVNALCAMCEEAD
jgi:uncharacterized protein (DUF1697 family)